MNDVQYSLTTASAIGRTASLAMYAMGGISTPCTTVTSACTSYPCSSGEVTVTLGADCPLPLGGAASGSVTVSGNFSSASRATLSQTFVNAQVAAQHDKALAVAGVGEATAAVSGDTTTITYSGANVTARAGVASAAVGASTNSWTVAVDSKGTTDPGDDVFTVSADGVSASVGSLTSSVKVASITDAVIDPSCHLNPVSGSASITEVGGLSAGGTTHIQFHSACDGKCDVSGSAEAFHLVP